MSELQDTINRIMSDPEAMRQVQSLGKQLGLGENAAKPSAPPPSSPGGEMMTALGKLAPMLQAAQPNDETAALLTALRPFLGEEKQKRLDSAQKLLRLVRLIPLLKDSGLFS